MRAFLLGFFAFVLAACSPDDRAFKIEGDGKVWGVQTLSFKGPAITEGREAFTDYALTVHFENHSIDGEPKHYSVIGYYAGDGDAGETGSNSGGIWKVKFVPDRAGHWLYEARLVSAPNLLISESLLGDDDITFLQYWGGGIEIKPADLDPAATDFTKRGKLADVKGRYLEYAGTGEPFIKTGAGSPENLLAYSGFDGTYDAGGTEFSALGDNQLHDFEPHLKDARAGDPTWQDVKGASILGIANYYEEVGVNAQYIVTMNIEGDGQDVFPYVSHDDPYVFDVSKLDQWQRVLEHYNSRGVMIDMLLTETENESWFEAVDGLSVGEDFAPSRKLYYREMVARFGHLNGLVWNLGEENGVIGNSGQDPYRAATSAKQRLEFGAYIAGLDPYDHAIVSHNWPDAEDATYGPKLGVDYWSGISLQAHQDYALKVRSWTGPIFMVGGKLIHKGRQWMVTVDEPLGWEFGARPDADVANRRREIEGVLWPTLLAGGAGVDWYFGWQNNAPTSDLSNEDQRSRDALWLASKRVADFMRDNIDVRTLSSSITNKKTGTIVAEGTDWDGRAVKFTLERKRPKLPEGEGHQPWEYEVERLAFERGGKLTWLDTLNPQLPK